MRKAVFFDRDGVLNVDKSYLGFIKDFEWMDGAKEALAYLTEEGYAIIVVTNQSGVARGYYTEDDVKVLHDWMCREAAKAGGIITAVYYCPYLEGAPVKAYDKKSDWHGPAGGERLRYRFETLFHDRRYAPRCGMWAAGRHGWLFIYWRQAGRFRPGHRRRKEGP